MWMRHHFAYPGVDGYTTRLSCASSLERASSEQEDLLHRINGIPSRPVPQDTLPSE